MASLVVLCADGSDHSTAALRAALALLRPDADLVVVTVVDPADPSLMTGTGFAGGTVSPETFTQIERDKEDEGRAILTETVASLGLGPVRTEMLRGQAGPTLCDYAAARSASAIVLGSRGHGGIKRAVLGSVSDHVVRHAPCPVIVTSHHATDVNGDQPGRR
jgi:nucleotide-binding universal stress UspA family protein